jgi:uncharacterized membrane protein YjjP (DUF1212 family)
MGRRLQALSGLGAALLEAGADSRATRRGVEAVGQWLCGQTHSLISYTCVIVSAADEERQHRTHVTNVPALGVDMSRLVILGRFSRDARNERTDLDMLERTLAAARDVAPPYPAALTILALAAGCAAFSRLFGGSWVTMLVTAIAAGIGFTLRRELGRRGANANLATLICAFVSGTASGIACWLSIHADPPIALSASVLYLVPGVPMVNAVEDLLHGHMSVGAARAAQAVLSSVSIALGLLAAVAVTGVPL